MAENAEWDTAIAYKNFLKKARENVEMMKARYNDLLLNETDMDTLGSIQNDIRILVIGTDRCSDSAGIIPILGRMEAAAPKIDLRVLDSDANARYHQQYKVNGKRKHLTDINTDRAIEFLHSCKRDQPFCLSLSFWAPHAVDGDPKQYFWPASCDHLYQNVTIPPPKTSDPEFFEAQPEFLRNSLNRERWYWRFDTPEKYQKMVKGYYRMISGVDMALGRLIEELRKLNMDQNTVFILMGDNGYFLGERGYAGKWTMHETSIRVPLIIYDPRRESSQRGLELNEMVLNVDITPTILDLAGISVPKMIQGNSLLPILEGKSTKWRSEVFCEHLWDHPKIPQTEAVRTTHWKYIRYPQHPEFEELYDLSHDPREENNLINKKHYAKQWIKLRTRCDRMIEVLTK